MISLSEQHPRLGLLNQADRQERITCGVNEFQLLDVIQEVDDHHVSGGSALNMHTVFGLHPAADAGAHRLDDDVNVAGAAGVFVERPERRPRAAPVVEVDG
ncbi:Uncharacterised protein [Mycobacteroides abscessus subsp. abscessus]|nr:Uncharacterised protein [Mycobacteroides abscessus subsp. abscessus]